MEFIQKHNCGGLCSEITCDSLEEVFIQFDIYGMIIIIGFCVKHAEEYERRISQEVNRRINDGGISRL